MEDALPLMETHADRVHTIMVGGGAVIIGADWDLDEVERCVSDGGALEVGGPSAMLLGHGLMLLRDGMPLVGIRHNEAAMEEFLAARQAPPPPTNPPEE